MQRNALLAAIAASLFFCLACAPQGGSSSSAPKPADDSEVAAKVGGVPITTQELDELIKEELFRRAASNPTELYDQRESALRRVIAERSLEIAAEQKGTEVSQLIAEKVASLGPVKDEDIAAFYEGNKARMGGAKIEDVTPQIRDFLAGQRQAQARSELADEVGVEIFLEPPRVSVAADGPSKGPEEAPVTIVEFSDFQCPYCRRVVPVIDQIMEKYPEQVRIVFRNYPLPNHSRAKPAAEASLCAAEQDRFWPFHDKIFENSRKLADEDFKVYAEEVGLDVAAFDQCYSEKRFSSQVDADIAAARAAGVTGTPAFFVNGVLLSGAKPAEQFFEAIDRELARLDEGA